jgi:hypothetical protein
VAKSIHNERARLAFARFVVVQAREQGHKIDPEALIRAINSAPAGGSTTTSGQEVGEPTDRAE